MLVPNWLAGFSNRVSAAGPRRGRNLRKTIGRTSRGQLLNPASLGIECLESRRLLAASVADPQTVVPSMGPVAVPEFPPQTEVYLNGGFLTGPSTDAPAEIAQRVLRDRAAQLGIQPADAASFRVTAVTTSPSSGLTHVYLRQQWNGIDIDGADANVSVLPDGRVLVVGSRLFSDVAARASGLQKISAADAILSAAAAVGIKSPQVGPLQQTLGGAEAARVYGGGNVSLGDVPAKLVYQQGADGRLHLSWNLSLQVPGSSDWFDMNIDASTRSVLRQNNWTHYSTVTAQGGGDAKPGAGVDTAGGSAALAGAAAVPNSGTYNVFALPVDAPNDGNRSLQVDPADSTASPFGWHDTNGSSGAEFTDTRGNNVSAQEDRDNNNSGGFRPDGGSTLNFDFTFDPTKTPQDNESAAITQLFYMNNILHDVHYHYGFDEVSGNFQVNNYGRGGQGNDAVQADAQDGSGTNNANFATPPDGFAPRMQQYIFTLTSPNRDSDFDNGIIIHEYGHGVSNRLTGGPANANALDALQSGGMGEGWSDWWTLMFTQRSTDTQNQGFGLGTYVLGQAPTAGGIRQYPYSYDMSVNPHTYGDYNTSNEVHDSGEIWASVLWDMNWLLINKHGYSSDLYSGTGGNNLAMQLVMDGLKLQPANPSFLDGRDAILAADQALTGGDNATEIWTAFARRGMGFSAFDGGSANATRVTEAFDMPSLPTGTVAFNAENYSVVDTVTIELRDSDLIGQPAVNVTVTSGGGDSEIVALASAGAGVFRGTIVTAGGTGIGNGVLNVAPAQIITVTYQDEHTGSGGIATVTDTATIAQDLTVFLADFSDDAGDPSLDGFTLTNSGATNPGQWHQTLGRGNQPGHSADDSLYYGAGEGAAGGGTYANSSAGRAISPVVRIPDAGVVKLRFNYFLDAEAGADFARVVVSEPGAANVVLATSASGLANPSSGWQTVTLDVSTFHGRDVQFQFEFTANDSNVREGWYIDDVEVVRVVTDFGQLTGIAFNDRDADGFQDQGEPVRTGWQVYIDANGNGVYDNSLQTATINATQVPLPIPDLSTATSTLFISGMGIVSDVNIRLDIDHTYDSDLGIFLIGPNGLQIPLSTGNGGSGRNYDQTIFDDEAAVSITNGSAPFNGRYRPESPLSALDGVSANGVWTLFVSDTVGIDFGVLNSWSIELTTGSNDPSQLTDEQGVYSFENLPAGAYQVRDVLPPDYQRTLPQSGVYNVTLAQNEVRSGLDFGSQDPLQRPVFTSPSAVSVPENTQTVLPVTATDADIPAQTITFSINEAFDGARFDITPEGLLTFASLPDFENPTDSNADNVYVVQVTADDGNFGLSTQTITVTVTPLNDNSPVFTSPASVHVAENLTAVTSVTATDADLPAQTVTYSITGGADRLKFSLTTAGVLKFVTAPDYENPADANRDNTYEVEITAADGAGRFAIQELLVIVDDADGRLSGIVFNDANNNGLQDSGELGRPNWQVILNTVLTTTVSSSTTPIPVFDGGTMNSSLSVTGQGIIADLNVQIDIDHTFDADLDIYLVSPGGTVIELTSDNGGSGNSYDQTVFDDEASISVANGAAPFRGSYRPESPLSLLDGTAANGVWTLRVSDDTTGDRGTLFGWSLHFKTILNEQSRLTNSQGRYEFDTLPEGAFSVRDMVQQGYERTLPVSGAYELSLGVNEVRTGVNFGNRLPVQAPVFTSTATPTVPEGTTDVVAITATDADLPPQPITFSLTGGADLARFALTSGGLLQFKSAPDFERPADANGDNIYLVQVTADDGSGGITRQDIAVTVSNLLETDVRVLSAVTDGAALLTVTYEIVNTAATPFDLSIVRSGDDVVENDLLLTSLPILSGDDLAVGTHIRSWAIGAGAGQVPLPGAGAAEIDGDYYLLAAADLAHSLVEEGGPGNNSTPIVGAYHLATGQLMIQGGAGPDLVTTTGNVSVTVNGTSFVYAPGTVTALRVRTHAGDDVVNLGGLVVAALVVGGEGNDVLTGGNVTDQLFGGPGNDVLTGNGGADTLAGEAGDDRATGGSGNDLYLFDADSALGSDILDEAGGGIDLLDFWLTTLLGLNVNLGLASVQAVNVNLSLTLSSATAFENLTGGLLADTLTGNSLVNSLQGGGGNDTVSGGDGNDVYLFDADQPLGVDTVVEGSGGGTDLINFSSTTTRSVTLDLGLTTTQVVNSNLSLILSAADGVENVTGGSLGDTLTGNALANTLSGGPGADLLAGAAGNDSLVGGAGNDSLTGGDGDDSYLFDADSALGTDSLVEGEGIGSGVDLLDFSQTTSLGVTIDLAQTALQTVNANLKLLLSSGAAFEMVVGSAKNDAISGNSLANVLFGGAGDDVLMALGGRDILFGGTGADSLSGGDDEDIVIGGITTYFNESSKLLDRAAIAAIMAEWTRGDLIYSARISNLRNGGGLNGTSRLNSLTLLTDGTAIDSLLGGEALDWFWKFGSDVITDLNTGGTETVN